MLQPSPIPNDQFFLNTSSSASGESASRESGFGLDNIASDKPPNMLCGRTTITMQHSLRACPIRDFEDYAHVSHNTIVDLQCGVNAENDCSHIVVNAPYSRLANGRELVHEIPSFISDFYNVALHELSVTYNVLGYSSNDMTCSLSTTFCNSISNYIPLLAFVPNYPAEIWKIMEVLHNFILAFYNKFLKFPTRVLLLNMVCDSPHEYIDRAIDVVLGRPSVFQDDEENDGNSPPYCKWLPTAPLAFSDTFAGACSALQDVWSRLLSNVIATVILTDKTTPLDKREYVVQKLPIHKEELIRFKQLPTIDCPSNSHCVKQCTMNDVFECRVQKYINLCNKAKYMVMAIFRTDCIGGKSDNDHVEVVLSHVISCFPLHALSMDDLWVWYILVGKLIQTRKNTCGTLLNKWECSKGSQQRRTKANVSDSLRKLGDSIRIYLGYKKVGSYSTKQPIYHIPNHHHGDANEK